jgi:hypothetical protein
MATLRRSKRKKRHSGSKKPVAKAVVLKSRRHAPIIAKQRRKRVVATPAGKNGNRDATPVVRTMNAEAPVAVAAQRDRMAQEFPFFWPALAMMRMWLGPRETAHSSK